MKTGRKLVWSAVVGGLVLAASAGVGVISGLAERDTAYTIDRFDQHVSISPDGRTQVVEDLDVTFSTERRGIFRDFDIQTPFPSMGNYTNVSVDQGDPASPWNFTTEPGPTGPRIRIGTASETLQPGGYRYRISYDAPSWYYQLADDPDRVEIRIDTPGFDWTTSIDASSLVLDAPGEILGAQCVEGPRRTTRACQNDPMIDGNRAVFAFRPFEDREAATIAVWVDADAFAANLALPTFDPDPLDDSGGLGPWPLTRVQTALLLFVLLAVPVLVWELLLARALYRDRVTDPALHDRVHPTAIPAPPHGMRPPEVAGLRLRHSPQDLFLSTLVDLEQRGLITTRTETQASGLLRRESQTLTVSQVPGVPDVAAEDQAVLTALFASGPTVTFTGTYDSAVASRVNTTKRSLAARVSGVFRTFGFTHEGGGLLAKRGFRALVTLGFLVFAAALIFVLAQATPLHPAAGGVVVFLTLAGWVLIRFLWRHHRLPLNSQGRDAAAQARSFEEFIRTVEQEQLDWAAGKPGIDHLHPAISLLPYAIALGMADSWYQRFSSVMRQLAAAAAAGGAAGGAAWWMNQQSFRDVSATQNASTTAPSSSGGGGGGGGGGSGGGGGGGGSW